MDNFAKTDVKGKLSIDNNVFEFFKHYPQPKKINSRAIYLSKKLFRLSVQT